MIRSPKGARGTYANDIDDIRKGRKILNDWETKFLHSVRRALERGRTLSEKQRAVIDNLWDES